MRKSIW